MAVHGFAEVRLMLATKTLWFSKAAAFEDGYEGFCLVTPLPIPKDEHGEVWLSDSIGGGPKTITVERMVAEMVHAAEEYFENPRDRLYVNSWCLADESMAMWHMERMAVESR